MKQQSVPKDTADMLRKTSIIKEKMTVGGVHLFARYVRKEKIQVFRYVIPVICPKKKGLQKK